MILIALIMIMTGLSIFIAFFYIDAVLDAHFASFEEFTKWLENYDDPDVIWGNGVAVNISQIIGFLGAALVFVVLFGRTSVNKFWLKIPAWTILIVPLLSIFAAPIIYGSQLLNEWMIPAGSWIEQNLKPLEDQAAELTEAMLQMPDSGALWMNIIAVAVIPAICEEFLFRGVIQSQLGKATKNIHVAIWLTAAFFSFIHFQFYGFIPRMLLGAFFGYLLIWTGSIWAPILAHFTNNAMAVLSYYYTQHSPDIDLEALEESSIEPVPFIVLGLLFTAGVFVFIKSSKWKSMKQAYQHFPTATDQVLGQHRMN